MPLELPPVQNNSLVLYKSRPARVTAIGDKIELELPDDKSIKVRKKDFLLLHPGPIQRLSDLHPLTGEIEEACEMLQGETTNLQELAELIYSEFSPSSAWATCELMLEGLYFYGRPDSIYVRPEDERQNVIATREQKVADKEAKQSLLERIKKGEITEEDKSELNDLERFSLGQTKKSWILNELTTGASQANAHSLLLKLGVWDEMRNPYPERSGFVTDVSLPALGSLPEDERLDLTHLEAFAIDDEGNTDPDDALSIDGDTLWVHIADAAAVVNPGSDADIHARGQSANLYLPEKIVPMLAPEVIPVLGLGIQETSPALSFGIRLNDDGSTAGVTICSSRVKVKRLTYANAQEILDTSPLKEIYAFTQRFAAWRTQRDAISLSIPEVKINVVNKKVVIKPLAYLDSREMVSNAMVMAGEATAHYAIQNNIPFPFTSQLPPELIEHPTDLAAMYAYRRKMKPGEVNIRPARHTGLGVDHYSRVTSPLRRYPDLLAHQQLRAFIRKEPLLDEQLMMQRIGEAETMTGKVRKLERLSNRHWTLVYLMQNPDWEGNAIVVENRERFSMAIIPELGLETRITTSKSLELNENIRLKAGRIDLPELTVHFSIL
ncbi:MAG: RNB domain-containing ribonuclease [Fibrobacteria bacterium]|nr:RNB domain-containing ribonuclease [Fibrobacteria bacterium]